MSPLNPLSLLLPSNPAGVSLFNALDMVATKFEKWQFDVSSFMVLLGESEEVNFRMMRRTLSECLSAAPVAGLQNYLRSTSQLYESVGQTYISPFGGKTAPLRNMRTAKTISHLDLLKHASCTVYRIKPRADESILRQIHWQSQAWVVLTWICFAAIMSVLCYVRTSTWIGISTCAVFTGWSILLRLLERQFIQNSQNKPSRPHSNDAVIFMGSRNSCLVLEGTRGDICDWTGLGVQPVDSNLAKISHRMSWVGSFIALLIVFIAIPNGSSTDQLAFVALNLLGQANVMIGQRLNAGSCLTKLEKANDEPAQTRTHVYGFLLRRFGNGKWVDDMHLVPKTEIWQMWRQRVIKEDTRDPKQLYEEILEETENEKCEKDFVKPRLDTKMTFSSIDTTLSGATLTP
ncbi:hypothetical protein NA57DRAFT_55257 [Rhizodiscina lignyota]|uniref:Uncharacterized protein n=1 Tax=Rhizodiscina lignyota TaxID=1504668 RepID=A0A9P4IE93_9PEZI|nr:hypothetical protein NA57DRAFT_55257 [Rhizodiscina lignyota]